MGVSVRVAAQQFPATGKAPSAQTSGPLAEAQSALSRGDPAKAIEILSDYLKSHPTDVSARLLLGQADLHAGQTNAAEAEYQTILKDSPNNVTALTVLGEVYTRTGQLEKAEPMLHRAAKASNGAPRIRMQWGIILARLHQYKEAQDALASVAPPLEPEERIQFYRVKASVASGLGDLATAAAEMEKALALRPRDAALAMATTVAELQCAQLPCNPRMNCLCGSG